MNIVFNNISHGHQTFRDFSPDRNIFIYGNQENLSLIIFEIFDFKVLILPNNIQNLKFISQMWRAIELGLSCKLMIDQAL